MVRFGSGSSEKLKPRNFRSEGFATLAIDRARPAVPHMDQSPPTSSFPSGHTSAAVALYLGLAVVLAMHTDHRWLKALCWLLLLVPVCVAVSRLYRGMHHPSDVTASFVNGALCVIIMARTILDRRVPWGRVPAGEHYAEGAAQRPPTSTRLS